MDIVLLEYSNKSSNSTCKSSTKLVTALQALQNFPSVGYSLARCRLEKFCIRRLWLCKVQALQNFTFVGYVLTKCKVCKILPSSVHGFTRCKPGKILAAWVTGLQGASLAYGRFFICGRGSYFTLFLTTEFFVVVQQIQLNCVPLHGTLEKNIYKLFFQKKKAFLEKTE